MSGFILSFMRYVYITCSRNLLKRLRSWTRKKRQIMCHIMSCAAANVTVFLLFENYSPFQKQASRCSIVVSIPACHAGDPGSIPGNGGTTIFVCSFLLLRPTVLFFSTNVKRTCFPNVMDNAKTSSTLPETRKHVTLFRKGKTLYNSHRKCSLLPVKTIIM